MGRYRDLLTFCLLALMIGSILALRDVQGSAVAQPLPRLTQAPSPTSSPTVTAKPALTATSTPTATLDPNATLTPTETATETPTNTPTITPTETPTATPLNVELLVNGGFEAGDPVDPEQALGWAAANISKDKRKCKAEKAYEGGCYYQFKNGLLERTKLTQTVTLPVSLQPGVQLQLSGAYLAKGDPKLKLKVTVTFTSLPPQRIALKFKGITYGNYQPFVSTPLMITGSVQAIDVLLLNKGTFGKILLDDLRLTATDGSLLPMRLP